MIKRLLVANRGEIAVRIMATASVLGIETVAVYAADAVVAAIADPEAREARYEELVAEQYTRGKALNTATAFEIDDVIDPADTRAVLTEMLARVTAARLNTPQPSPGVGQVGLAPEPRAEPRFVRHQDFSVSGAKARRGPQPGDGPPPEPNITGRVTLGPSSPAQQCHR